MQGGLLRLGPSSVDAPPRAVQCACVRVDVTYFHYLCDGFDDRGWGCAYRSAQTILSWYVHAGLAPQDFVVPTVPDIQHTLVHSCHDKPASFLGSKQWIGSFEISLVLQALLGVTSRVVRVAEGRQVDTITALLAQHFASSPVPVMAGSLGGGAITLLGIAHQAHDEQALVLVLDPHYVGRDTKEATCKRPWLYWARLAEAFQPSQFYNFLLPQDRVAGAPIHPAAPPPPPDDGQWEIEVVESG